MYGEVSKLEVMFSLLVSNGVRLREKPRELREVEEDWNCQLEDHN